jgi:Na+-transporting NADH:ubiquinone oxidoreductase subunit NqrB
MNTPIRRFLKTPKGTLSAVFAALLAVAGTATGWSVVLPHVMAALAGACGVELLWGLIADRKLRWPSSALLSGTIVAFVLAPQSPLAVTLWIASLATISKYILRTSRGHIFNPAALALLASIPLFAAGQSWWGAGADMAWPIALLVVAGGAVVVDKINKFPLVLTFAATYFAAFTLFGLIDPTAVAEMFRAPFVQAALFLGMFMLTDPPTSPARYIDQVWIGALAAVTSCIAQLAGAGQAYLLIGVLVGNAALALSRAVRARSAQRAMNYWREAPDAT